MERQLVLMAKWNIESHGLTEGDEAVDHASNHGGCVYLDLESDPFLPVSQWNLTPSEGGIVYGLKELSVALAVLEHYNVPLSREKLDGILGRRPPALRYASGFLPHNASNTHQRLFISPPESSFPRILHARTAQRYRRHVSAG